MNEIKKLEKIKKKIDSKFLHLQDVKGTAIKMKDNKYVIVIYVKKIDPVLKQAIPEEMEGIKVYIEEIGEVRPL
jgi:uncharacterized protein involved in exopolysaccharide biosynthesis